MLELFSPELLVATSNDEASVQDIIRQRLARGVPPSYGNRKQKLYVNNSSTLFGAENSGVKSRYAESNFDGNKSEPTVRRLVGTDALEKSHKRYDGRRKVPDEEKYAKRDVLQTYLRAQQNRNSNAHSKIWSGRRQSDTQKIRKAIEADVHQLTMNFDDDASDHQEDSLYDSGNPNNAFLNRSPQSSMPSASKLNKMRSKSYIALEKEVEALRLKLGSRRKESVDSLYSSSDFKTKAADDVRRILESD